MGTVIRVVVASRKNSQSSITENLDSNSVSQLSKTDNNSRVSNLKKLSSSNNIELGSREVDRSKELHFEALQRTRKLFNKKIVTSENFSKKIIKIGKLYKNIQHSIGKDKQVFIFFFLRGVE